MYLVQVTFQHSSYTPSHHVAAQPPADREPHAPAQARVAGVSRPQDAADTRCLYRFMEYKRKELPHPIPRARTASVAIVYVCTVGDADG